MRSTVRTSARTSMLGLCALLALSILGACGSSSESGGGSFRLIATIFGYDKFSGGFPPTGAGGQPPTIPQNMCLIFEFSSAIDPATVSTESIVVQEVNLNVNPPAPGPDAGASFSVRNGNQLIVCPLITFSDSNVTYGFQPGVSYQMVFQVEPAPKVMRSKSGRAIAEADAGPYIFQTNSQIFDRQPGPPEPTVTVLDATTGADVGLVDVPFKPVPQILISFNEPVIPSTILSDPDAGSSSSLHVELDIDGDTELTTGDRITIPGRYELVQDELSAVVTWTSLLTEIPTAPETCAYVVTVDGTVTDLAGNSKVLDTNDPSVTDVEVFFTKPGASSGPSDGSFEDFTSRDNESTVTSARWGTASPGFLTSGVGGGTGEHGPFDPLDNVNFPPPELVAQIVVDKPNKLVTIQTEDQANPGNQFVYQFVSLSVPIAWVVETQGPFPLEMQVSGDSIFRGQLDLGGQDGATTTVGQLAGGAGGAAALGGAAGGSGGGITDGAGNSAMFPANGGAVGYPSLGFVDTVDPGQGMSGRVATVTDFTITESNSAVDMSAFFGGDFDDVWLQPNTASDDYRFERFHTSFKVTGVSWNGIDNTITVQSDANAADYRGPLIIETDNPYLEEDANGVHTPILTEVGDPFVIGHLMGRDGSDVFDADLDGTADQSTSYNAGAGSEPQGVMQTFTTLGKSGGGGGGGAATAGFAGADDPSVDTGPGLFGGTGWIGGAGGDASPTLVVATQISSTQIQFQGTPFDDGFGAPDSRFVGHLLNPVITQGQVFSISVVDAVDICTITPIDTLAGDRLDLDSVEGLGSNSTARLTPPYTAGGTGGGGSGVHCAGSGKQPKGNEGYPLDDSRRTDGAPDTDFYDDADSDILEDDQEQIFLLPQWVVGAGGGAGGGALRLIVAGEVTVTSGGGISADGGDGGESDGVGALAASGGGAGAGGTIFIGVGQAVSINPGGSITARGGAGGGQSSETPGGDGGNGRVRFENEDGDMTPGDFVGLTVPAMTQEHLGAFPGGGNSLGQSSFLSGGVLVPDFQSITLIYDYVESGVAVQSAVYKVNRDGSVDSSSNLDPPPFDLLINFTTADSETALPIDPPPANFASFLDPTDPGGELFNFVGLPYFRFRIVLDDPSNATFTQTNVQIDSIQIEVNGSKPS